MELQPATFTQIQRAADGRLIEIEEDVQNCVNDIRAMDPSLRVRWSEVSNYYVVYQVIGDKEELVTTAQTLDPRLVNRVREVIHPSYDLVGEMERMDQQAERDQEHAFEEKVGEAGERLAHALRTDLGHKGKIFVPKKED